MRRRALALAALALLSPALAHAEELGTDPKPAWDERDGWVSEFGVGGGIGFVGGSASDRSARPIGPSGETVVRVSVHHVREFRSKGVLGLEAGALAWCMPLMMCGGLPGIMLGPKSGFLGNELGIDVSARVLHGAIGAGGDSLVTGYAFGVRPSLRVAHNGRFRTASYLGWIMPEVGVAFVSGVPREAYLDFSFYPVAMRIGAKYAVEWEIVRERIGIPLDGARVSVGLGTSFTLLFL